MRKFLIVLFLLICSTASRAQIDTAFWFAAPDISSDFGYDQPIQVVITAFQQPCVVTVSIPANAAIVPQVVNLPANTTQIVDLTPWLVELECAPANLVLNKGLKILSDNKISAYYSVSAGGPNPDFFSLKGINSLGTSFYISSQYILDNSPEYSPAAISSFNIVATQDNTQVTVTPSKDIIGHLAGSTFTITLNRGQTYAAIATSQLAANHLQGSSVTSTKPIAITLADDLLNGGVFGSTCRDLAGDQTVPVNVIGTEYVAIKSNLNFPYDKVYITATQNNTTVTQDGTLVTTLGLGQSTQLTISQPVTYIQTSNPAYAFQLSGYGCEVGAAVLPKINCTGSPSVSVTRTTTEEFSVCLLVKNGGQGNFLVNNVTGIITAGNFSVVPGTANQWYYAKITLPISTYPYGSVITISNTTTLFQEGILAGSTLGNGFGYFSNFNTLLANAYTADTTVCTGQSFQLMADSIPSSTYSWSGPGGFSSNNQNPVLTNVNATNDGEYILTVNVPDCGIYRDTINMHILPVITTNINQTICEGQIYQGYTVTGTYTDIFVSQNGCDSTRILHLTVKPKSLLTVTQSICAGQSFLGYSATGTYVDTYTAANGCDSIRTLILTVIPRTYSTINQTICEGNTYLGYSVSGVYHDTLVNAAGCDSVRTLNLTVTPKAHTNINQAICQGQTYLGYSIAGIYADTFTGINGCDSIRTLNLTVNQPSVSSITQTICEGESYGGHTTTGTYIDVFTNSNGCDSTRTLFLTVLSRSVTNITEQICQGQVFEGYNTTGVYHDTLIAVNGCDSVRILDLTVNPVFATVINHSICSGQSYEGYSTPGTFTDTFTTASGCDSIRKLILAVDVPPHPELGGNQSICIGETVILSPGTFTSYVWQDGSTNPTYSVSSGNQYYVTVTNSCGSATDSIKVQANICDIIFPTAFTPNNDGTNDVFKPLHVYAFQDYHLSIFNRWGERIFETNDFKTGWNGTYKGIKADADTYVWYCNFTKAGKDGKLKGTVVLIR